MLNPNKEDHQEIMWVNAVQAVRESSFSLSVWAIVCENVT